MGTYLFNAVFPRSDKIIPDVYKRVVVGGPLVERKELCERPPHEVDDGPGVGAGKLAVLHVGQVHLLGSGLVHGGGVEPGKPEKLCNRHYLLLGPK
jgi:hypothetical protein